MFYSGVIEDRTTDPLKLGRCKVRIVGLHTDNKTDLPTSQLPWAVIMQPVNSAAMSGIGISPTGPVEGTWVVVIFQDEYQQYPIIIGTLAGIPEKTVATPKTVPGKLVTSDGTVVVDGSGNPVQAGTATEEEPPQKIFKPTTALTTSSAGFSHIKSEEGLASTVQGKRVIGKDTLSKSTPLYAYQDSKGIWTIGWGNTYLANGEKVNQNTSITKEEADALLENKVRTEFESGVKKSLKVPVTQEMFDALVGIAYNTGVGGLTNSKMFAALNAGEYTTAAALILDTRNTGGLLLNRREREKTFFLSGGVPEKDMSDVKDVPSNITPEVDKTQNPVVVPKQTATTQQQSTQYDSGFVDPNSVYPKYYNEPDVHRLARHEKIDQTIVFAKEAARVTGVVSGGGATWSQPKVPYNAAYPFNHARITESGHVEEFDDTANNERLHWYHRAGTYEEIDKNGSRINRIVGDDFEILERNGNVIIKGTCNVTIKGNSNLRVENNSNIDVLGDVTMTVGGNMSTGVTGNYYVKCNGKFSVDAQRIDFNSGKSAGVKMPSGSATGLPEFPELSVNDRFTGEMSNYESPDEGDSTEYVKANYAKGAVDPDEVAAQKAEQDNKSDEQKAAESEKIAPTPIEKKEVDCTGSVNEEKFTSSFALSDNFTLGKCKCLPTGPAQGLKASEIVCNMKKVAVNCLEPIKSMYPNMVISSGLRAGTGTSDHLTGSAIDFQLSGFTNQQYFDAAIKIAKTLGAYTQLILERRGSTVWIHISYSEKKGLRKESFTMVNDARISPNLNTLVLP